MIFVPFSFFLLFFIRSYKKHGFDVGTYMALLFLITSTVAIYLRYVNHYWGNLMDLSVVEINFVPTLVYCTTIGLCISPFAKLNTSRKRYFEPFRGTKIMDVIVGVSFISTIFILIIYFKDVTSALFSSSLLDVRQDARAYENETPITRLSGIWRILGSITNKVTTASFLLIPYFFYSKCFLNKKKYFNICLILCTVTPIIKSIIHADRSVTVFYVFQFVLAYLIFRPYMDERAKSSLKRVVMFFGGVLFLYFGAVTVSRFEVTDDGVLFGLLRYIGSTFFNFCIIWDDLGYVPVYIDRVFPITSTILGLNRGSEIYSFINWVYESQGVRLNVFYSFVGTFLIDIGRWAAVVFPLILFLLNRMAIKPIRKNNTMNLFQVYCIYTLGIIIVCGSVVYYYDTIDRAAPVYLYLLFMFFLCKKKKIN